ncbi:hypothetical protein ACLB2K_013837 [Fragaria x ananassa]
MECSCFIGDLEERKLSKLLSALNRVLNSIADLREKRREINQNYEEQIVECFRVGLPQEALPRAEILVQMESTNKAIDLIHCFCERLVMRLLNHRRLTVLVVLHGGSVCDEVARIFTRSESLLGEGLIGSDRVYGKHGGYVCVLFAACGKESGRRCRPCSVGRYIIALVLFVHHEVLGGYTTGLIL